MPLTLSPTSRYIGVPIVNDADGRELFEIRDPVQFEIVEGMVRLVLGAGDTLHSLAAGIWGDAQLWWLLADYNGIFDITTEVFEGREVFVPTIDFVRDALNRPGA